MRNIEPESDENQRASRDNARYIGGLKLAAQLAPSFSNRACIDCGEWSASGGLSCEDCQENALYDY